MPEIGLKTTGRLAGQILMVVAAVGPRFVEAHPATADTCSPPLMWRVRATTRLASRAAALGRAANLGESAPLLLVFCLPAGLVFVSTLFLLVGGERGGVVGRRSEGMGGAGAYVLIWFAGIRYLYLI